MDKNISEQAISKAAEVGIESQLENVQELNIDVATNPLGVAQGKIDSVIIDGKEIEMEKGLKAKRMVLQTDEIKINPLKAALGNLEIEHETNAEAKLVLSESDLQRAFNSQFIRDKLKNQKLELDGRQLTVNARNIEFSLPDRDKIQLIADIQIVESQTSQKVSFTATATADRANNRIILKDIEYENDNDNNITLAKALIDSTQEILDLRNFELDGVSLQIQRLDIRRGKMTIAGKATVSDFV